MNEKVRKFAQIFEGLEEGWGQFIAQDTDEKTGKQKGKYYIGDKPITENNFLNHLQGTGPSLLVLFLFAKIIHVPGEQLILMSTRRTVLNQKI